MVELRDHAEDIVRAVQKGQRFVLTYRGRPVLRLEPCGDRPKKGAQDPFYRLADLAEPGSGSLSNAEIDKTVYGT